MKVFQLFLLLSLIAFVLAQRGGGGGNGNGGNNGGGGNGGGGNGGGGNGGGGNTDSNTNTDSSDEEPDLDLDDFNPACVVDADCESADCDTNGANVNGDEEYHYCDEPNNCDEDDAPRVDGICNNLDNGKRLRGSTGHLQLRRIEGTYANDVTASAREVSDAVGAQVGDIPNNFGTSSLLVFFGQFIDHDITIIHMDAEDNHVIEGTGRVPDINFEASEAIGGENNAPYLLNDLTAYLDLSQVYGADQHTSDTLRSGEDGELLSRFIDGKEYLPLVTDLEEEIEIANGDLPNMMAAGDVRVNEHNVLTSFHTLFLREHNRLAREISAENRRWSDEQIFQEARRWNTAQWQNIVLNEYFPAWHHEELPEYTGYDDDESPDIDILFSTASYRFGHSAIQNLVKRIDEDGVDHSIELSTAFFNPNNILTEGHGGVDSFLKGITNQCHERVDTRITDGLRNALFDDIPGTGGSPSMDLFTLNIERGRDHELPRYTDTREYFGLSVPETFDEVTGGFACLTEILENLYDSVDDCDFMVCGLAEPATFGHMGELFYVLQRDQFTRIRDADRFFFENTDNNGPGFTNAERAQIRDTFIHDILRRNTFLTGGNPNNENFIQDAFETDECCRSTGNVGDDTICVRRGNGNGFASVQMSHCESLERVAEGGAWFAGSRICDCDCNCDVVCDDVDDLQWAPERDCCEDGECSYGNGGCAADSECADGLVCGIDNCNYLFGPRVWPNDSWDCCVRACSDFRHPEWTADEDCCSPEMPCTEGNGDCDSDDDCVGDLVCGTDNCNVAGVFTGFPTGADCCTEA